MGVYGGSLGHEQSTGSAGPLGVVLKAEVPMDVVLVRPEPGEGTEDDTMFEVHATDADGLKELRRRGHDSRCKRAGSVGRLKVFGDESPSAAPWAFYTQRTVRRFFNFHSFVVETSKRRPSRSKNALIRLRRIITRNGKKATGLVMTN